MHRVPCLLSDAVGTAAYIADRVDGMVFKSGDSHDLREKILWCIRNKDAVEKMRNEAYKIYKTFFSVEAFGKNLLAYVGEMAGMARGQTDG